MAEQKDDKKLLDTISNIEKQFGKGAIIKLGDKPKFEYEVISSGSIILNAALGAGGYPKGRIVEIFGPESSGKTTLAIHAIAEEQQQGGRAAIIDVEHAFDPNYAEAIGVDIDNLYFSQPGNGEQALEIVDALLKSEQFGVIVVDSVAALISQKEIDGEIGDSNIALTARLMSQAMRKLVGTASKSNTLLIFINQIRDKIGGMGYGPTTTTTGGHALKFAASQRLEVKRIGSEKTGDEITANKVKVKIVKNKTAPPFREAEFAIEFGIGIDKVQEVIDLAVENKLIIKSGSWFSLPDGTKLGQGSANVKILLNDNPELLDELEMKVKALYK